MQRFHKGRQEKLQHRHSGRAQNHVGTDALVRPAEQSSAHMRPHIEKPAPRRLGLCDSCELGGDSWIRSGWLSTVPLHSSEQISLHLYLLQRMSSEENWCSNVTRKMRGV